MKNLSVKVFLVFVILLSLFSACSVEPVNNSNSVTYIVAFDSQGGGAVFPQLVDSGGKAVEPSVPSKTDYVFGGWYKEPECSNAWAFSTDTVISNTILYARWIETLYACIVTFDSCGGLSIVPSQTVKTGEKLIEPAPPFSTNSTFGAWYKDAECTNVWEFSTDTVLSNITLYAKWIDLSALTYVFNGIEFTITGFLGSGEVVIPDRINGWRVTMIGSGAFQECTNLISIVIPNTVTNIFDYSFYECFYLSSVVIGDSVISIGAYAFYKCTYLTNIIIGKNVTSIGNSVFNFCAEIKDMYMYPMTAPVLYGVPFPEIFGCTLHLKPGATGYNEYPWNETMKFSSVVYDL